MSSSLGSTRLDIAEVLNVFILINLPNLLIQSPCMMVVLERLPYHFGCIFVGLLLTTQLYLLLSKDCTRRQIVWGPQFPFETDLLIALWLIESRVLKCLQRVSARWVSTNLALASLRVVNCAMFSVRVLGVEIGLDINLGVDLRRRSRLAMIVDGLVVWQHRCTCSFLQLVRLLRLSVLLILLVRTPVYRRFQARI